MNLFRRFLLRRQQIKVWKAYEAEVLAKMDAERFGYERSLPEPVQPPYPDPRLNWMMKDPHDG